MYAFMYVCIRLEAVVRSEAGDVFIACVYAGCHWYWAGACMHVGIIHIHTERTKMSRWHVYMYES
jgi:hypothetical protein